MATHAPTNNCIADIASPNATIAEILTTLPFGFGGSGIGGSCSSYSPTTSSNLAFVDKLQQAIESLDLSVTIPAHRELSLLGYYSIESNAVSGKYALDIPDIRGIVGVSIGFAIQVLFGVLFATIIYRTLLNRSENEKKKVSSLRKGVIGTTLLTSCIVLPYALIDFLEVQNTAGRFAVSILFLSIYLFRTLEALFGFVPPGAATSSWGVYCAYFSLPFDMMFDDTVDTDTDDTKTTSSNKSKSNKPIMATYRDIWNGSINLLKSVTFMIVMCSILSPYRYKPFGETNAGEFHEKIVLGDYLDVRHLGNCFVIAVFFQQALGLGDAAVGNAIQIFLGYKAKQIMRNPMLEATSPSDFWGRRWNVLVHTVMKRGVYKPVRKYWFSSSASGAVVASLAVFVASGIFHEWLVHAVFMYNRPSTTHFDADASKVLLGSNTAFFVWNFVVIVCERILAGTKGVKSFGKMIPSMFIPFMIIMTSLPMAHWFGNPYLNGNFFADYEQFFPLIRRV